MIEIDGNEYSVRYEGEVVEICENDRIVVRFQSMGEFVRLLRFFAKITQDVDKKVLTDNLN